MTWKKLIPSGDKLPLKLTAPQRKLILEGLLCLDQEYEQALRQTPAGEPLLMTLDDLDDFAGYIAAEANHCEDKKKQKALDRIFDKIQHLLDTYTDQEPAKTTKIDW